MNYPKRYFDETIEIARRIDLNQVDRMIETLAKTREQGGRLFFLGVGGSAANCSHAVNDFRKLAGFEAYFPGDNVAELTARTNDEGWETVFAGWLQVSRLGPKDCLFVMSVGGGNLEKNVSLNIVKALQYGKEMGSSIVGIVGRDGGYTAKVADAVVLIPTLSPDSITAHAEAWQGVVWHMMVNDPRILRASNKWEGIDKQGKK